MDIREMKQVIALARHLNFTKAARELGITQSALSKSIQAIESRTKCRLFDRDRGGVHITANGRGLAERAASILAEAQGLDSYLSNLSKGEAGEVKFGITLLPARAMLAACLLRISQRQPDLSFRVDVRSTASLLEALLAEDIEFFIAPEEGLANDRTLRREKLGPFPVAYIVRPGHPALKGNGQFMFDYPILVPGNFPGDVLPTEFPRRDQRQVRFAVEDLEVLAKITEQSDAIWLSSPFAVREELAQGRLTELPLGRPRPSIRMAIYTLSKRTISAASRLVLREFLQELNALQTTSGQSTAQAARTT